MIINVIIKMTSETIKTNYTFGVDLGSSLAGRALIPAIAGHVTSNMETSSSGLMEMIRKPNLFTRVGWATTSGIVKFSFPGNLFGAYVDQEAFYNQVIRMFAYIKFGLRFRFKINGTPFHKGLYQFAWIPGDYNGTGTYSEFDVNTLMVAPSVRLSASCTTEFTLDVPSIFTNEFFSMHEIFSGENALADRLGTLLGQPVTPLEVATGLNSTVQISCWFEFTDLQLAGPTIMRLGTPVLAPDDAIANSAYPIHQGLVDAVTDPLMGAAKSVVSGAIDGAGRFVKTTLASLPFVGDMMVGLNDKPLLKTEPLKVCRTSATSWVHGVGVSSAASLSVVPGLFRPPRPEEIGKAGSILEYIQIPALIITADASTTTNPYSKLISTNVNPGRPHDAITTLFSGTPAITLNGHLFVDTPLSYVSKMYRMWRGTMKYTLEVVIPATSTCTVAICWIPDQTFDGTLYQGIASQCSTWLVDCNGPTTSHFEVKFMSRQRYKFVMPADSQPSALLSDTSSNHDYCNGSIAVYLVNSFTANVASPATATFRLYQSAGSDFEFIMPGGCLMNVLTYGNPDPGLYVPPGARVPVVSKPIVAKPVHQGLTDDQNVAAEQIIPANEVVTTGPPILNQMVLSEPILGESHMDWSILKRYQTFYVQDWSTTATTNTVITVPVSPCVMGYLRGGTLLGERTHAYPARFSTLISHMSGAFKFWRGSMNYRCLIQSPNRDLVVRAYYVPNTDELELAHRVSPSPGLSTQINVYNVNTLPTPAQQTAVQPGSSYVRNDAMYCHLAGNFGMELITNVDNGVLEVNVPYFSANPVKTTMAYRPVSTSLSAPQTLIGQVDDVSSAPVSGAPWMHMNGNVVFVVANPSEAVIRIELMYALGDDFAFSYPMPPARVHILDAVEYNPYPTE